MASKRARHVLNTASDQLHAQSGSATGLVGTGCIGEVDGQITFQPRSYSVPPAPPPTPIMLPVSASAPEMNEFDNLAMWSAPTSPQQVEDGGKQTRASRKKSTKGGRDALFADCSSANLFVVKKLKDKEKEMELLKTEPAAPKVELTETERPWNPGMLK